MAAAAARANAASSSGGRASGPRVRRIAVSALEAASSLETALPRRSGIGTGTGTGTGALPETPAGMPRRKARLQQTPSRHSARKASIAAATATALTTAVAAPRTPEEIRASFDQLVASTAARYASGGSSATKTRARRRARSESDVSSAQASTPNAPRRATPGSGAAKRLPFASPASSVATLEFDSSDDDAEDKGGASDDANDNASAATVHRKRTPRRKESPAAAQSSKQVRVRTCVLSALSPPRAPLPQDGNTTEDEELLRIQKRLVFGTRKPPPSPRTDTRAEQCASPQYSRSGRLTVPPMEWWRNERLTTDRDGVTVFHAGSPAHAATPSRKSKTTVKRAPAPTPTPASARKPPRVPKAASKAGAKTPKAPTMARKPARAKTSVVKAKRAIELPSAESEDASEWTRAQLDALAAAKMQIPTTAANFWADVAAFVPGKSANECRTKSFEDFASPTQRKRKAKALDAGATQVPAKLHRAGSNRFKKQVREFVQQLETKHVDDVFENTTPSKLGLAGLDELQSPHAPLDSAASGDDDDDDDDDLAYAGRRELKSSVSASKRDEVDSYVLRLKRSRVLGDLTGATTTATALRTSAIFTPSKDTPARKKRKRAVLMYEEVGAHRVEGVVSPGGTTRVRIDKDSDATSDDDDERDSDDEHSSDDAFV